MGYEDVFCGGKKTWTSRKEFRVECKKIICISITVYEEQDFWEKLHYKLPHKKMQRIQTNAENAGNAENPNQTEIELEPFVNGVNHNSVWCDNTVINTRILPNSILPQN